MDVRDANASDADAITAIYNDAVSRATAIWNNAKVDIANRLTWLAEGERQGNPVLVAIVEDELIGYASFGDWRVWDGYRYTVKRSVYVRADRQRGGIGEALVVALIQRTEAIGKHIMVAGIEATNVASIRLHDKLGFERAGLLREVDTKFDVWLDLVFMQLTIDTRSPPETLQ